MADHRIHPAAPRPGGALRLSWLGLGACLSLVACADPQSGGGTELPIQVRIYGAAQAKAWRLWDVQEVEVAGRTSLHFTSHGSLQDSGGVLALPSSPGTYLLEAWTSRMPSDTLPVRSSAAPGVVLDPACLQIIPQDGELHQAQFCTSLDPTLSPSGADSATAADRLTLVRIEGQTIQRLQILDDLGSRRMLPGEARLWSVSAQPGADQTLDFRGILRRESDGTFRFPVVRGTVRWVIEAATNPEDLPLRIAQRTRIDSGWSRFVACQEGVLPPLPSILSVHACPDLGWTPSGRDRGQAGADLWSVFSTTLP